MVFCKSSEQSKKSITSLQSVLNFLYIEPGGRILFEIIKIHEFTLKCDILQHLLCSNCVKVTYYCKICLNNTALAATQASCVGLGWNRVKGAG